MTTTLIVADYSFDHPKIGDLKAALVVAVGRYYGQGVPPKNLTRAEAQELSDAGLSIVSIFEFGADQVTGGGQQAGVDVGVCQSQAVQTGMPPDRPVYFAGDFDVPDYAPQLPNQPQHARAKLGPVGDYYARVHQVLGGRAGAYGGYWLISRLFDSGLIHWGFQTRAWSAWDPARTAPPNSVIIAGTAWDTRACLRQTGQTILGGVADVDVPERTDFGQWSLRPPAAPPLKTQIQTALGKVAAALADTAQLVSRLP